MLDDLQISVIDCVDDENDILLPIYRFTLFYTLSFLNLKRESVLVFMIQEAGMILIQLVTTV